MTIDRFEPREPGSRNAGGRRTPRATVIGAGPAGLMAAEVLAAGGVAVTVYDRMASPGRKFLLAGRGGLNLTHSEPDDAFMARYAGHADGLRPAIRQFGPIALRDWCAALGIDTFVGSSGRIFPTSFKTSPLLRAWLRRLDADGVRLALRHTWRGFDADGASRFDTSGGPVSVRADVTILALGGASWPQLGSDGAWVSRLDDGEVEPLRPANCGFSIAWSDRFRDAHEGAPLKSIAVSVGEAKARGDCVITRAGLEGGAIYAVAAALRRAIAEGDGSFHLDLRPDLPRATLAARLARRGAKASLSTALRKTLGLTPAAIGLLRDVAGPDLARLDHAALAALIGAVPLRATAPMPIARAISSAGGVRFAALDDDLMLRSRAGIFVAGEMIDWEAPTGGYLLQACFATGALAGAGALRHLRCVEKEGERGRDDFEGDPGAAEGQVS